MATEHRHIRILAAEPSGRGLIIHFSDGTTTLFEAHFLYEVREQNGNVALTDMSEEELMKEFDD
jgi:hypothetical protein